MSKILTAIFLCATSSIASAQSSGHAISGAGASSCGQYLEASSDKLLSQIHVTWAQGFLSGLNVAEYAATKKPLVLLPDAATIEAYLDKFCRDNPLEKPMSGTFALFREVQARRDAGLP